MTREELEARKYSLEAIQTYVNQAEEEIGEIGCTHKTNIARAMIEHNRLVNEELERGRFGALR